MDATRKKARQWLRNCTKVEFEKACEDAMLTPRQLEFIDLKIAKDMSCTQIALKWHIDDSVVKRVLGCAYDKIYRVIE